MFLGYFVVKGIKPKTNRNKPKTFEPLWKPAFVRCPCRRVGVLRDLRQCVNPRSINPAPMTTEAYDDAMFDFSRGEFDSAIGKLKEVLAKEPENFDAQLALGMAFYRKGDFASAIAEGHKAEKLRPREQLVHTNLSLFYMKTGERAKAEYHGFQAKVESWREDAKKQKEGAKAEAAPELQMARPAPQPMKFPSQPWKKKNDK